MGTEKNRVSKQIKEVKNRVKKFSYFKRIRKAQDIIKFLFIQGCKESKFSNLLCH